MHFGLLCVDANEGRRAFMLKIAILKILVFSDAYIAINLGYQLLAGVDPS